MKTERVKVTLTHPLDKAQTVEFFADITFPENAKDNKELKEPHGTWDAMAALWYRALETTRHREFKRRELQGKYNLKGELQKLGTTPTEALDIVAKVKAMSPEQRKVLGL